jgi:uncharacterized membrane protein
MATYTIIGGDKKEYGPVTTDDVREWIADGRLEAKSLARGENETEFRPLSSFSEFAEALKARDTAFVTRSAAPPPFAGSTNFAERDYELDLGGCISRGWELLKTNMGLMLGSFLIYLGIEIVLGGLGKIPLIGFVFSLLNFFITGALMGGLYYVYLQAIRGQPAQVGDVFAGFRRAFWQLFLGYIVPALLAGLCLIPFVVVLIIKIIPVVGQLPSGNNLTQNDLLKFLPVIESSASVIVPALFLCMLPMLYLQTSWAFTLPLIIDKQMDFWTAMKTSWKMVGKHWWQVFGLIILVGLLNIVGVLACCVGLLFTIPIGFAALMYAYETIFAET